MAFNRRAPSTQRFLEEESNVYVEQLLQKTRALNSVAGEISVQIRESCDDIDKIVGFLISPPLLRLFRFFVNNFFFVVVAVGCKNGQE